MLARLSPTWERIRTSLWFFPVLLTLVAVALAVAALQLGAVSLDKRFTAWWLHPGDGADAAELLSNLLTSLITMTTLAVSITMVVITLAAQQLGPRLIRNFMADTRTQWVLGFFLGTVVYLVLVRRGVHGDMTPDEVPRLAVSLAMVLLLASVYVLLFFVHHLSRSVIADTMVARVGADLEEAIEQFLPEQETTEEPVAALAERPPVSHALLRLPRGGYVQAIDHAGLIAAASKHDALIELDFRPGHHLLPGGRHGRVSPPAALTEEMLAAVRESVVRGSERTAAQDLEFSIRELVEIALRALSPGINDPATAIAVIDRLGRAMAGVLQRATARGEWYDADGALRVITRAPTTAGLFDAAWNEIRQSGDGHPAILIHLLDTFAKLAEVARTAEQRDAIRVHVGLVQDAGRRTIHEPYDLVALEERGARALRLLEDRPTSQPAPDSARRRRPAVQHSAESRDCGE